MEKLVYLVHRNAEVPGDALRDALTGPLVGRRGEGGARDIAINVDDVAQGEKVLIRRSSPPIRAMVSFWMDDSQDRGDCETALSELADGLHGYLVLESVPLVNTTMRAAAGERTPGANLVTCISRRSDISEAYFLDRWYNEHRDVALATQSTFAYVRNTIVRPLTRDAPPWDGIVEESFPIEALTDQHVWYDSGGDDALLGERIKGMVASVGAFLDLSVLESTPMSEYRL